MATFKGIALPHHLKEDGSIRLKILVYHNKQKKYIDTGLVANIKDLTKSYEIKSETFKDAIFDIIRPYRDKCNDNPRKVSEMSCSQLAQWLTAPNEIVSLDFIEFAVLYIVKLKKDGRKMTARDYQTAINCVKRFIGSDMLPVQEITVKFLQKFSEFIITNPANKNDTAGMCRAPSHYLGSIRALHNQMKLHYNDEESGIIPITGSPFTIFKVPKPPVTEKRAISPEMIYKIFNHPDSQSRKSTEFNRVNLARDCFILSFALIGMNSADMYDCTQISAKSITYNRKKTRSRRDDNAKIVVDIQTEIKALIEKYRDKTGNRVFCFYQHYRDESTFNAAINKGLKKIIPELEFYSARHSWATIAVNDCGIDKYTVHSALNHIDETMRVTDVYLKKNFKPINAANRKVLDFVLTKKAESTH